MESETLNIASTVSPGHIRHLWEHSDILVLVVDLNDYGTLNSAHLDETEREYQEQLQTGYFKKRFLASRMVLKSILGILLDKQSVSDVSLCKDKYGRIHVSEHDDLNICISYTENVFFLAISKVELGIDAEKKRALCLKDASKYLKTEESCDSKYAADLKLLTEWTFKEAYCKFSNKSIFPYLTKTPDANNVYHSTYLINDEYILAVVTGYDQYTINICCIERNLFD